MSTYDDEMVAAARRNALALCLAQLGDVNAMGNDEAFRVLDEIGDDATSVYFLVRVMTTAINALASSSASSLTTKGASAEYAVASKLMRIAITESRFTTRPKEGTD